MFATWLLLWFSLLTLHSVPGDHFNCYVSRLNHNRMGEDRSGGIGPTAQNSNGIFCRNAAITR